jgi:hypothetical protein
LKARAAQEGRPVKALILQCVEQVLTSERSARGHKVRLPLVRSRRPGALRLDNVQIYDVISFP